MGARGEAVRMIAWKCPTCTDLHTKRADAVECCNDAVEEARRVQRDRAKGRMMRAARVRVDNIMRDSTGWGDRVPVTTATIRCGFHRCGRVLSISIRRVRWVNGKRIYMDVRNRARALALAQYARHIDASHWWDGGR